VLLVGSLLVVAVQADGQSFHPLQRLRHTDGRSVAFDSPENTEVQHDSFGRRKTDVSTKIDSFKACENNQGPFGKKMKLSVRHAPQLSTSSKRLLHAFQGYASISVVSAVQY